MSYGLHSQDRMKLLSLLKAIHRFIFSATKTILMDKEDSLFAPTGSSGGGAYIFRHLFPCLVTCFLSFHERICTFDDLNQVFEYGSNVSSPL